MSVCLYFRCGEVDGYGPDDACITAPCPPPGYLHLVCDVNIGHVTCAVRARIIERCLHRFSGIYTHSQWNTCLDSHRTCDKIVEFLKREHLIDQSYHRPSSTSVVGGDDHKPTVVNHSSVTSNLLTTPDPGISVSVVTWTSIGSSVTMGTDEVSNAGFFPMKDSYIWPVIGTVVILIEFVVLCA